MKLKGINKVHKGKFVSRYDLSYTLENGETKNYEMVSRNHNIDNLKDVQNNTVDAVIIIATDETGNKILLNREFRLAVGDWIYNFPAGLIDDGESVEESARRELREETGLTLTEVVDTLCGAYSAVGISNEVTLCIVCKATGEFSKSTSAEEEIEAGWFTKEQVRELLKTEKFAARTQAYCYLWSKE